MRYLFPQMDIRFSKWEGTGNDFILLDDRQGRHGAMADTWVQRMCDRHFGIGSDGLILIQAPREPGTRYHMEFLNPDGSRSFCGNGSRCAFAFWRSLENGALAPGEEVGFTAIDGSHRARLLADGQIGIAMRPPREQEQLAPEMDHLHTGSPHVVVWVEDPEKVDLVTVAHGIRYNSRFKQAGVNVNLAAWIDGAVHMRTYERGVEDETLSCGTGVTAAAWSARERGLATGDVISVRTRGGALRVDLGDAARSGEALLCGPVREVFTGTYLF